MVNFSSSSEATDSPKLPITIRSHQVRIRSGGDFHVIPHVRLPPIGVAGIPIRTLETLRAMHPINVPDERDEPVAAEVVRQLHRVEEVGEAGYRAGVVALGDQAEDLLGGRVVEPQ